MIYKICGNCVKIYLIFAESWVCASPSHMDKTKTEGQCLVTCVSRNKIQG